jgi:hypothetical protein
MKSASTLRNYHGIHMMAHDNSIFHIFMYNIIIMTLIGIVETDLSKICRYHIIIGWKYSVRIIYYL